MAERKFVPDKVYLQGPKGQIYDYEPLLARQAGWKPVTPNSTKKATKNAEANMEDKEVQSRQAQQRHVGESAQAERTTDTNSNDVPRASAKEANNAKDADKTAAKGQDDKNK